MPLFLVTPPADVVITVDDAKALARVTQTDEDSLFETFLIPAATERAEAATNRQFLSAQWRLTLDVFPDCGWIDVPKPPLISVDAITYVDLAGDEQIWDPVNYVVDAPAGPRCRRGRIALGWQKVWPITQPRPSAVRIDFTAGYGSFPTDVPAQLRQAIAMDVGTLFLYREDILAEQGLTVAPMPHRSAAIYQSFRSYAQQRECY